MISTANIFRLSPLLFSHSFNTAPASISCSSAPPPSSVCFPSSITSPFSYCNILSFSSLSPSPHPPFSLPSCFCFPIYILTYPFFLISTLNIVPSFLPVVFLFTSSLPFLLFPLNMSLVFLPLSSFYLSPLSLWLSPCPPPPPPPPALAKLPPPFVSGGVSGKHALPGRLSLARRLISLTNWFDKI